MCCGRRVGRELHAPRRETLDDQLGQAGFMERRLSAGQCGYVLRQDVDTDHAVPEAGHAGRVHGTEIATAHD
jgi:hypothetical protein